MPKLFASGTEPVSTLGQFYGITFVAKQIPQNAQVLLTAHAFNHNAGVNLGPDGQDHFSFRSGVASARVIRRVSR